MYPENEGDIIKKMNIISKIQKIFLVTNFLVVKSVKDV